MLTILVVYKVYFKFEFFSISLYIRKRGKDEKREGKS